MSWNSPSDPALYARKQTRTTSLWQPATRVACSGVAYLAARQGFWCVLSSAIRSRW